jgi:hypothetical protein
MGVAFLPRCAPGRNLRLPPPFPLPRMARPTHEQAVAVKSRWEREWLSRPGVTAVDVGGRTRDGQPTEELAIRIYVARKAAAPPEILALREVEGIPVEVIERSFRPQ